ncbi:MAG TPA: XRE family transcriptional regulator [Ruminococcaceae bacterium]|nr:XRE family transcriptional regulator [Oscillospiraceae bacterium]
MEPKIIEIAQRIKGLREMSEISPDELAVAVGISADEYLEYENGEKDFTFTFLYLCAEKLGVDIVELLTGENPRLSTFSITREGSGLPIKRREGFQYFHLAATFKDKLFEPFMVKAPYKEEFDRQPIALSRHEGQEFDYVLKGSLRMTVDGHEFLLNEGDSVTYDSSKGHGMNAAGGGDCVFLAIILKKQ